MSFPIAPRVIYGRNPLREVVCQLRFPKILRISGESPTAFQELIRDEYPIYHEGAEDSVSDIPPPFAKILASVTDGVKQYNFLSADERWKVTLNSGFLALTAIGYERWETFKQHLLRPMTALIEIYKPAFFSRAGLRYLNAIIRSELGLDDVDWSELLEPHILGEISKISGIGEIVHAGRELLLSKIDGKYQVIIKHGLGKATEKNEECFLIDADFFTQERMETANASQVLDDFNRQAGRLFRWCITDRLHDAMGPITAP